MIEPPWISNSRVVSCKLVVASWYEKHELVINGWVCPSFCELYYILTSCKLEFEWFLWRVLSKLRVEFSFSWLAHELKLLFRQTLRVVQSASYIKFHTVAFFSHNIFIILPIPRINLSFEILCEITKNHKNRLGWNLLGFLMVSLEYVLEKSPESLA